MRPGPNGLVLVPLARKVETATLARVFKVKKVTFSRAREIPRLGAPPPLRSAQRPAGLKNLSGVDAIRVRSANSLVSFMASCCRSLSQRDVCWSIENPACSLLWQLPCLKHLVFDACMFGSMRKKRTAVLSNKSWFQGLAQDCSGGHRHLPWGKTSVDGVSVWSTAMESAYTTQLSSVWASLAAEQCSEQLLSSPMSRKRKRKLRFEPDFSDKLTLDGDAARCFKGWKTPAKIPQSWTCFPKGSKLVQWIEATQQAVISIPLQPLQWVRRAYLIAHPSLDAEEVPLCIKKAVSAEVHEPPTVLAKRRTLASMQLAKLCTECTTLEETARSSVDPLVNSVTASKRTVALEKLLQEIHFPDLAVAGQVRNGFPLVGWLEPSGLWPPQILPPSLTPQALLDNAFSIGMSGVRSALRGKGDDVSAKVWQTTCEECSQGWLTIEDFQQASLVNTVVSSRFGVVQKGKVRPIDNFKSSFINACCGTTEKVQVDSVDQLPAVCLEWLRQGTPESPEQRIVGRTWDL